MRLQPQNGTHQLQVFRGHRTQALPDGLHAQGAPKLFHRRRHQRSAAGIADGRAIDRARQPPVVPPPAAAEGAPPRRLQDVKVKARKLVPGVKPLEAGSKTILVAPVNLVVDRHGVANAGAGIIQRKGRNAGTFGVLRAVHGVQGCVREELPPLSTNTALACEHEGLRPGTSEVSLQEGSVKEEEREEPGGLEQCQQRQAQPQADAAGLGFDALLAPWTARQHHHKPHQEEGD
mmetsp:Transcript_68898/g.164167  ORF Transcript_68898/g.164167 Transcript_68898/m.164167 type:complete len:233 (+) Transcript_68898:203-901(+)